MNKGSPASLARSSAVMAGGTMVSRLLGLARMALLAAAIGNQTPAANVWETANTLPNTIYLLLAAGVLNVLLLPQLTRAMTRGEQGQDYIDRLLTLAITIIAAGTVFFVLAAPLVTKLYALPWPWGGPMLELAILFAYLCIPQLLFYGLHTLMGQILAAHHRFAAFMWSPALANVIAIAGIIIFIRRYPGAGAIPLEDWTGGMIWLLAGSATVGIMVQALVLIPAVRATGFRYRPRWGFRGVGLRTAGVMAVWALADVAVSQGGLLVVSNLLGWVAEVEPSAPARATYNYAFSTFVLPHSLIALSLLTAIYPLLSKAAAADDLRLMAQHAVRGLRMLGAAMVPISLGMIVLTPLVLRVLFPRGVDPEAMGPVVIALCMGLVPYGVYLLCARVFYSFEDARTPFLFQVAITTVLLVVVVFAFTQSPWRAALLVACGQALGQGTAAVLGLRAVRRRLPWIGLRAIGATYLRVAGASVVALVPTWALIELLDRPGWAGALITLAVAGPFYLLIYALLAHKLGVPELAEVAAPLLRRLPARLRSRNGGPKQPPDGASTNAEVAAVASPAQELAEGTLRLDEAPVDPDSGRSGEDSTMDRLEVGTRLGDRYALDELLARREGGTLDYWSAHDTTLGRLVAVTVLPAAGEHEGTARTVLDSARRVASVDDPRLVRVLDVGDEDGLCWIVEEGLSEAESLASLTREQALPAEEVRRIVGETAAGLESARRRGLHHLYLNPHSVLRTSDGTIKISGVGVASALEGTDDVTADEASIIDSADLVALLYTGLTGRWPGEELPGVRPARRLADDSVPAPSELVSGVPGDLDSLCRAVLGSGDDLQGAPHTPGELVRQLSPWSSEIVRGPRPSEFGAPKGQSTDGGEQAAASAALTTAAGASAAVTAAHPAPSGEDEGGADPTGRVPQSYYRSEQAARSGAAGASAGATTGPAGEDETGEVDRLLGGRREDRPASTDAEHARHPAPARVAGGGSGSGTPAAPGDQPRPRPGRSAAATGAGLREERRSGSGGSGVQTAIVMVVIAALLGVAVWMAWNVISGLGDSDDPASPTEASTPTDPATDAGDDEGDDVPATGAPEDEEATAAPEDEDEPTAPPASDGGPLPVLGITSFDPQGTGDENSELAPLAVDGDPDTEWRSLTYLAPNWGGLKSGTGLILDLGEGATVAEVEVLLGDGEMGAELYLADRPSISGDGSVLLGEGEDLSGTWTITPESAQEGRYLILWFTQAHTSSAGELVRVAEITVR